MQDSESSKLESNFSPEKITDLKGHGRAFSTHDRVWARSLAAHLHKEGRQYNRQRAHLKSLKNVSKTRLFELIIEAGGLFGHKVFILEDCFFWGRYFPFAFYFHFPVGIERQKKMKRILNVIKRIGLYTDPG